MGSEQFWRRQQELAANTPIAWLSVADDLLAATELLQPEFDRHFDDIIRGDYRHKVGHLGRPIYLLRAFAIESLLKARAARQGHRFIEGGRFVPILKGTNDHDLVALAKATKFRVTDQEKDHLRMLTDAIELGRYPAAKSWRAGLREHPEPNVGMVATFVFRNGRDVTFDRMVKRLKRMVRGPRGRNPSKPARLAR